MAHDGHVLVVAHRNVNKMLVKSLLGLSFEAGYRVEHRNNWLYIFAPQSKKVYLLKIKSPIGEVKIISGYERID